MQFSNICIIKPSYKTVLCGDEKYIFVYIYRAIHTYRETNDKKKIESFLSVIKIVMGTFKPFKY